MKCYMFNDDVIEWFTPRAKEYLSIQLANHAFVMRYNFASKIVGGTTDSYRLYAMLSTCARGFRWYGPNDVKTVPFFGFSIPVENFKRV